MTSGRESQRPPPGRRHGQGGPAHRRAHVSARPRRGPALQRAHDPHLHRRAAPLVTAREMAQLDLEELAARDPVERGQLASSEVSPTCVPCRRSGRTRDTMDARLWRRRCLRARTSWASSGWSTNSRPMRSNWDSATPCRRCSRSGKNVSLVGARGVGPTLCE